MRRILRRIAWEVRVVLGRTEFDRHCQECQCDRWQLCPEGDRLFQKWRRREG